MTINQERTFRSMFFHKLLARVCQTLKVKIRCFGYGYETTKLEYRDQTTRVQFGGYDTTIIHKP